MPTMGSTEMFSSSLGCNKSWMIFSLSSSLPIMPAEWTKEWVPLSLLRGRLSSARSVSRHLTLPAAIASNPSFIRFNFRPIVERNIRGLEDEKHRSTWNSKIDKNRLGFNFYLSQYDSTNIRFSALTSAISLGSVWTAISNKNKIF